MTDQSEFEQRAAEAIRQKVVETQQYADALEARIQAQDPVVATYGRKRRDFLLQLAMGGTAAHARLAKLRNVVSPHGVVPQTALPCGLWAKGGG